MVEEAKVEELKPQTDVAAKVGNKKIESKAGKKVESVEAAGVKRRKKHSKEDTDAFKEKARDARQQAREKILAQEFVKDAPKDHLERLADSFDSSAKRWEMIVYPLMIMFIVLAIFGFYLIYNLTHDVAVLSKAVTRMADIVSVATPKVTNDMSKMSSEMRQMNHSMYGMQHNMSGLNHTVSNGPMGFMNDMMPFSSNSYYPSPPVMPPPPHARPAPPINFGQQKPGEASQKPR